MFPGVGASDHAPAGPRSLPATPIPDLLKRDFTANRLGCKFIGDITYIPTWQGLVYLATVIDCFS